MTKRQRREHKAANQERKAFILKQARTVAKPSRHVWAAMSVGQDGKYTKRRTAA